MAPQFLHIVVGLALPTCRFPRVRDRALPLKPITFPVGVINDEWREEDPRIHGTPTWFLLDQQGVIRKVVIGKQTITGGWFDGLKGDLQKLLPKEAAKPRVDAEAAR